MLRIATRTLVAVALLSSGFASGGAVATEGVHRLRDRPAIAAVGAGSVAVLRAGHRTAQEADTLHIATLRARAA